MRGFAGAMRALARKPALPAGLDAIDIVGTGGDASGSLNLSTGAALLAAACGLPVVKHGNRSISSRSGSADLIEQLGFTLPLDEIRAAQCFAATGFTFLFAPVFSSGDEGVGADPRRARHAHGVQFAGAADESRGAALPLDRRLRRADRGVDGGTLAGMDIERAWVVHGAAGWDEATPIGPFLAFDVTRGAVRRLDIDPREFATGAVPARAISPAAMPPPISRHCSRCSRAAIAARICAALALQCGLALHIAGRAASIASGNRRGASCRGQRPGARVAAELEAIRRRPGTGMSGFLDDMARSSAARVAEALAA